MTEKELIYSILNVVRNSEHNNDEGVPERLLRHFASVHRADSMRKYYKDGQVVDDEVFQKIPITLQKVNDFFVVKIPQVIRFINHYGFYIEKYGSSITIGTSQEFHLNKRNPFNSKFIQSKTEGNDLFIRLPDSLEGLDQAEENYSVIKGFLDSIYQQELFNYNNPNEATPVVIELDFYAILQNPDDCPTYDWENDPYPFPAERLPELEQQILVREFGIMNQSKKDEIQNARADEVRYHDNEQVQNS